MFGTDRLSGCLANHGLDPVGELLDDVLRCQRAFCGSQRLTDDVPVVVMGLK